MSQDEIFWLERQLWGRVTSPSSFPNHACSAACFVKEALLSDLLLCVLKQDCQRGPAVGLDTRSSDKDFRPRQPFLPTQLTALWLSHSQSLHSLCGRQAATVPCWTDPLSLQSCASGPPTSLPATKEDHRRRELRRNQLGT